MQKELEQIIKDYNLEGTRIQVGRQRIYPQREGLNATPDQLDSLKSFLAGNSVKGTLRITAGETVIAANSGGAIDKAFDPGLLPNQHKSSEVKLMQSTETPAVKPAGESYVSENNTSVVETTLEALTTETASEAPALSEIPQLAQEPSIIQSASTAQEDPKSQSVTAPISENEQAKIRYLELLSQHPRMAGQEIPSADQLLAKGPAEQRQADKFVSEMAASQDIDPYEHTRILAQGSPYVNSNLDNKKAFDGNPTLGLDANPTKMSEGLNYLSDKSTAYRTASLEKAYPLEQINSVAQPSYENIPNEVEQIANQTTLDELTRAQQQTQEVDPVDYPRNAQTLDPSTSLKTAIAQGSVTVKETVVSASETLALAQKNLTTFAKHVKHRGLKAWAKDQLPLLQNRAKELVQTQATKLGEFVREQAPFVRDATIAGAQQVSQTVVQYAKDQAPVVAAQANAIGQQVAAKFTELTQRVDPAQIERLGTIVLSQDEQFAGNVFDFKKGATGIDISLKNGTPVFRNGKLNPTLDTSYAIRLSKMAEQLEAVKPVQTTSAAQVEEKKKAVAR